MLPESKVNEPYADIQDCVIPIPQGLMDRLRTPTRERKLLLASGEVEVRRVAAKPHYMPAIKRQPARVASFVQQMHERSLRQSYVTYYAKFGITVGQ